MAAAPAKRRTQEERSAATQARLLNAAVARLVELGHGGTTTIVVAERAGVSRGAQLHRFPIEIGPGGETGWPRTRRRRSRT